MSGWNEHCKFAPDEPTAKHCKAINEGKISDRKALSRKFKRNQKRKKEEDPVIVGKGYFGCARKCNKFESKSTRR